MSHPVMVNAAATALFLLTGPHAMVDGVAAINVAAAVNAVVTANSVAANTILVNVVFLTPEPRRRQ